MSKNFFSVYTISESNRESSSKITVLVLCSGKYGTQDLKDGCDSPAAKQAGAKVNLGCLESLLEFEGELQGKQTGGANWESKLGKQTAGPTNILQEAAASSGPAGHAGCRGNPCSTGSDRHACSLKQ